MDESVLGEKCTVFCVLCTAGVSKDWPSVYFAVQSVLCTLRATLSEQLRAVLGWVSHVPGWRGWPRSRWPLDASPCCSLACNHLLSLTTVWQLHKLTHRQSPLRNKYGMAGSDAAETAEQVISPSPRICAFLWHLATSKVLKKRRWMYCREVFGPRLIGDWRLWLLTKKISARLWLLTIGQAHYNPSLGYASWYEVSRTRLLHFWKLPPEPQQITTLDIFVKTNQRYFFQSEKISNLVAFECLGDSTATQRSFVDWLIRDRFLIAPLRKAPIENGPRWR